MPFKKVEINGKSGIWSGKKEVPKMGEKVQVTMNGLGPAIVTGHFVEAVYLGCTCSLLEPPAWWLRQVEDLPFNERDVQVFGIEID